MNLLYIHSGRLPSQAANTVHVMKMCKALAKEGVNVTLLVPGVKGEQRDTGLIFDFYGIEKGLFNIKLINSPIKKYTLPFFIIGLFQFFVFQKNVAVYGRSVFGCLISSLFRIPTILEVHAPIWKISYLQKIAFRLVRKSSRLKHLVVISEELKSIYESEISKEKIVVLHDAADQVEGARLPAERNLENPILGYVGGLYEGKGIETISSISKLLPEIYILVYGGTSSQIKEWEKKCGPRVIFKGFLNQSEIQVAFESFHIGLLPNKSKVFTHNGQKVNISSYTSPLKMFEYMANKKLVMSSDFKVLREVLSDEIAYLIDSDDETQWVKAINEVRCNPKKALLKIEKAYETFRRDYTWTVRAKSIINLYC